LNFTHVYSEVTILYGCDKAIFVARRVSIVRADRCFQNISCVCVRFNMGVRITLFQTRHYRSIETK
jgi:hypothetical protein